MRTKPLLMDRGEVKVFRISCLQLLVNPFHLVGKGWVVG